MVDVIIMVNDIRIRAISYDTPTANKIEQIHPFQSIASTWGDEIYFDIPLTTDLEADACQDVQVGDLGYWPDGPSFCIFSELTQQVHPTGPGPTAR